MFELSHKTKQFFFVLIKLSIVLAAFYFIYNKLTHSSDLKFSVFTNFSLQHHRFSVKTMGAMLLLSGLNWFFEIVKWKLLVRPVKPIPLAEAAKQSLGALTASLFTPNRIGEYGAKALFFTPEKRKKVMFANLIGNMLQMAVTVILGTIGLYFYCKLYRPEINLYHLNWLFLIVLAGLAFVVFIATKKQWPLKKRLMESPLTFIKTLGKQQLYLSLLLAFFRYVIFSFQFYVLLDCFGVELNYLQTMSVVSSMYLLASVVPSLSIFDVVVRGSVAVYLFSFTGANELAILSTVTIMWTFNFALPSIWGSYYVLIFKLPKNVAA